MAFWEVVMEGRQGVDDMLNVMHYQDNMSGVVDWDTIATVMRGHLETHLAPICAPEVTWTGITVREDIPGGVGTFYPFGAGTLVGTNADGDQLRQASVLVRKVCAGTVKPTKGWAFQGGITTRLLSGVSRWDAGATSAAQDYWEDIRIINFGVGGQLQLLVKARNPTAPNTQPYGVVTSVQAVNVPRTVKNRRESVGS